jgi:hypothetical protein
MLGGLIFIRSSLAQTNSLDGTKDNGHSAIHHYKSLTFPAKNYKSVYGLTREIAG